MTFPVVIGDLFFGLPLRWGHGGRRCPRGRCTASVSFTGAAASFVFNCVIFLQGSSRFLFILSFLLAYAFSVLITLLSNAVRI